MPFQVLASYNLIWSGNLSSHLLAFRLDLRNVYFSNCMADSKIQMLVSCKVINNPCK